MGKKKTSAKRIKWQLGILGFLVLILALMAALTFIGLRSSSYIISDNQVTIDAGEYRFTPATLQATAEEVTFLVTNRGKIPHVFAIRGPGLYTSTPLINPGRRAALTVKFEQIGEYKLICPVRGHPERGMVGNLKVVAVQDGDRTAGG